MTFLLSLENDRSTLYLHYHHTKTISVSDLTIQQQNVQAEIEILEDSSLGVEHEEKMEKLKERYQTAQQSITSMQTEMQRLSKELEANQTEIARLELEATKSKLDNVQ